MTDAADATPPLPELAARLDAAVPLARDAGRRTLDAFADPRLAVERKRDGSVVTEVDRDTETWLRTAIAGAFPSDAILGEEHDDSGATGAHAAGWQWIIDPIDGTYSFVHGVPLYGTLVAVAYDGMPVIGVIEMPALDERVYASRGGGAWHGRGSADPVPARVSDVDDPGDGLVCFTGSELFRAADRDGALSALTTTFGTTRGWSDCYAHLLCATGRCDAVVEPTMAPWDLAPMLPIMIEAGGRCTDWSGAVTAFGGSSVSSNGRLHDAVLDLVNG